MCSLQDIIQIKEPLINSKTALRQAPPERAFSQTRSPRCTFLAGGRMPAKVRLDSEFG